MALKLYIGIFIVMVLSATAVGAKYYYDTTQATIATLRENNAKLEVANETNQATIQRLAQDAQALQAQMDSLNSDLQAAEEYKNELLAKLQKHDLSQLSLRKPGLIEQRINNGTKAIFDELEALSNPAPIIDNTTD